MGGFGVGVRVGPPALAGIARIADAKIEQATARMRFTLTSLFPLRVPFNSPHGDHTPLASRWQAAQDRASAGFFPFVTDFPLGSPLFRELILSPAAAILSRSSRGATTSTASPQPRIQGVISTVPATVTVRFTAPFLSSLIRCEGCQIDSLTRAAAGG